MKAIFKITTAIVVAGAIGVGVSRMNDDGGMFAVLSDEAPPLVSQWGWQDSATPIRFAAFVTAGIAVFAGSRAGEADFDKLEKFDELTASIPYMYWDEIMRNDNLAAALRARRRQLVRIASENT